MRKTLGFPLYNIKETRGDGDSTGFLTHSPASPDLNSLASLEQPPTASRAERKRQYDSPSTANARNFTVNSQTHKPEPATKMEEREMTQGQFEAKPLEVQDGVAVLEESVELHVPDVMTQV